MVFPTSDPLPSGPWHVAHFVRNVALVVALSGPGLARTIETTKSVRPAKSSSRIAEPQITWRSTLSCVMTFPSIRICHSSLRTISLQRARRLSTQAKLCNRQIPHAFASCRKNGVAERRHKRRHSWLTDARWRSVAVDDVYVGLGRRLSNSSYRIILKIRLVDRTLRSRNLTTSHNAGAEDRGALELGSGRLWIYHQARIQNCVDSRNTNLAL